MQGLKKILQDNNKKRLVQAETQEVNVTKKYIRNPKKRNKENARSKIQN